MDSTTILIVTTGILMFLTLIGVSYKTGFVAYSIWSLTKKDQPKFKIDKNNTRKFAAVVGVTFALNIGYNLAVMRDLTQLAAILLLSAFNTLVLAWGLSFWILLKRVGN